MSDHPQEDRRRPSTRRPRKKAPRKFPWRLVVLGILLIALGVAGNWYRVKFMDTQDPGGFETFVVEETTEISRMGDRSVVLVYPEWDATGYVTEERQMASRDRIGEDLLNLMRQLCEGPKISGSVSPFPEGTVANAAFFNPQNESVVLDFSMELVTGHPGGSAAEVATLTSILRTVALNFPETRSCTILVEGAQVETLAGHLNLDQAFDPRRWL
jgi:Sporulation and spore germination